MSHRFCCILFIILSFVLHLDADDKVAPEKPILTNDHAKRIQAGTVLFKESVRQILLDRCVECHGGETLEGEFNIATREGLLRGGEKGTAIVPGKSRESLLYRLLTHDAKPHMPYDEEKLPAAELSAIAKWIDLEAPYDQPLVEGSEDLKDWTESTISDDAREFWSFRPLLSTRPPDIQDPWCKTDIDRFVLKALQSQKIKPNDLADRRVLIRRTHFGLTGLPPEPEDLARFMNDSSEDWYEGMLDDLLSSQHFGERWARHWLDIARFAESHGFEQDYNRDFAYHYRDFVIQAFNMDMPFDQFVQWQLAGDEIAPDDPLALMATGFLGAGVFPTQLTENEFEPARYDELDDMVSTMGTSMLGMTIGCARCHDHKYDPIPAADYYRLVSTFGATIRSHVEVDLAPKETERLLTDWETAHRPLVKQLNDFKNQELGKRFDHWRTTKAAEELKTSSTPEWLILHVTEAKSGGGATLTMQPDESILATGINPDFDTYTFTAETQLRDIRSFRLEALSHESMVKGGPGRAGNGNMGLGTISILAEPVSGDAKPVAVTLTNPRATFQQNTSNLSIAASIDATANTGWAVDPQFGKDHAAIFDFAEPVGFEAGTRLTVTMDFKVNNKHNIGRTRLSISNAKEGMTFDASSKPQALAELQQLISSGVTPDKFQREEFLTWYRTIDPEWQKLSAAVAAHKQLMPTPKLTTVMISSEGVKPLKHHADGRGFPHFYEEIFYLKRGDTTQKIRKAEPGFLQVLTRSNALETEWSVKVPDGWHTTFRRRKLANWMTDTETGAGHLLARVIVNRLWLHHMGSGIVSTPNDFGKQGELPSHPELLDWLAQRLIEEEWKLKPIHKLIMLSAAYQQSSAHDELRASIDPDNRFQWRREPHRLEAEVIRDSMLLVGNQLDRTPYGPGTLNEAQPRRSIYFMIKRSKLIPMMQIFDSPEPLASVGKRPSTTIASQALLFMNSPHVRRYATGFAQIVQERSSDDLIAGVYLRAISRKPTQIERDAATEFLTSQSASYVADGKSMNDANRLALTDFCQTVFSLNEFVFVE